MKRIISIVLCFGMLFGLCFSAGAYQEETASELNGTIIFVDEASGITIIEELIVNENTRASTKTATKKQTVQKSGETVAVIALTAVFSYTGTSVSVVDVDVTETTYDGWSFTRTALAYNGGTATLTGKVSKLFHISTAIDITITCDVNGNIS